MGTPTPTRVLSGCLQRHSGPADRMTRREFLRGASAAFAAPWVVASSALGLAGRSPSERIAMGFIGTGAQGMGNLKTFLYRDDVQVLAVCDVDSSRREEARKVVEEHYARKSQGTGRQQCASYSDFRELVARDDIDAVVISTPDHWHTIPALEAVRSGKDVYCEKPLTLTIAEGRVLADAVRRYGRVFQTGSQQRSSDKFRLACELVRNGRIGALRLIKTGLVRGRATGLHAAEPVPKGFDYEMWLGQAPWAPYCKERCHYNFRFILDYSGGQMTNWGAHHNDIAQWGNGTDLSGPVEVEGRGEFPADGLYDAPIDFEVEYTYANGVRLLCSTKNRSGVTFEGSEGWIYVDRGQLAANPPSVLGSVIKPNEIRLYESRDHHRNFLDCVRSRSETVAPAEIGHRSATVCHLGNIAMLLRRRLRWDPGRERFVNDPEADRMIARAMRAPWRL